MTEEVKAVVKLYWEIVGKAAKPLHGHEISYVPVSVEVVTC